MTSQDWIEIAVPALIAEETFALAQKQLEKNKHHALRRTVVPTLLQGILVCQHCGYTLYRASTQIAQPAPAGRHRDEIVRANCRLCVWGGYSAAGFLRCLRLCLNVPH